MKRANAQKELLELAVLIINKASAIVLCQLQKSKASGLSTQEFEDDKGSKCQDTFLQPFHLTEEAWSFAATANASYPAPTEDKRTRQLEGMLLGVIQHCTKCLGKGNVSVAFLLKTKRHLFLQCPDVKADLMAPNFLCSLFHVSSQNPARRRIVHISFMNGRDSTYTLLAQQWPRSWLIETCIFWKPKLSYV